MHSAARRVTALFEIVPHDKQIPNIQDAPPIKDGAAVQGEREVGKDDLVLVKVRYEQPGATESDPALEVVHKCAADREAPAFADASLSSPQP